MAVLLLVAGAFFGIAGAAALGRNRTIFPRPRAGATLVVHGIYAWVRHPLYTSVILLSFAWAAAWGSLPAAGLAAVETAFLVAKARHEEAWLVTLFPEYGEYRRRVRRFLPGIF